MRTLARLILLVTLACCALPAGAAKAQTGLLGRYYDDYTLVDGIVTFDEADLVATRIDRTLDFWSGLCHHTWQPVSSGDHYGVRWTGYLRIDEAGEYGFGTISDDGSLVFVDGQLLVGNGNDQYWDWEDSISEGSYQGLYPENYGLPDDLPGPVYLDAGYHTIDIRFFESGVYDGIEVWWLRPGRGESSIPYFGYHCDAGGFTVNAATNWELIPSDVLSVAVAPVPEADRQALLHAACPNPFNPQTRIAFEMPRAGRATLRVYDLAQRLVATLIDGETLEAGPHAVDWLGRDLQGRPCASGLYFYRLETAGETLTGRMTLLK